MGCCSARCTLILVCCLQLITALEKQVFDFLGYLWALIIIINFIHVMVVILGLFGAIQHRLRHVVMYLPGMLLWVGWNVFVSCLYLDLEGLSKLLGFVNACFLISTFTEDDSCVPLMLKKT